MGDRDGERFDEQERQSMTSAPVLNPRARELMRTEWETLLADWREFDPPEGRRAEVSSDGIVMSPAPAGRHNGIASKVNRQLAAALDPEYDLTFNQAIRIDEARRLTIPDLIVLDSWRLDTDEGDIPPDGVHLVVEVTSPSNADTDRHAKRLAYAQGGIPQYLLIDRYDRNGPSVILYSDPVSGTYRKRTPVRFGERIQLGPPIDVKIDTSVFPVRGLGRDDRS